MLKIEQISPSAHRMIVEGRIADDEFERAVEYAASVANRDTSTNLLIEIKEVAASSISEVLGEMDEVPTLLRALRKMDRIAVVADTILLRTASRFESAMLPGISYEVYAFDEIDAARRWVEGTSDRPHGDAVSEIVLDDPRIAAFQISGRIDRETAENMIVALSAKFEQPGCNRLMMVIENWHGFDPDIVLSEEVIRGKLDLANKFDRYAIVGGPDWTRAIASAFGKLSKGEIRGFKSSEQADAEAWLRG